MEFLQLLKHDLSEVDIIPILHTITGQVYSFATATDMRWGRSGRVENLGEEFPDVFYQLMPEVLDDGVFDWYYHNRENRQFFACKETAVLHFIY